MATLTAWKQFVANVPEAQREYRTIEIAHPQLAQAYRYVASYKDITLRLESGIDVLFSAAHLQITEPSERQDSEQSLLIELGDVAGTVHWIIDQISGAGFFTPAGLIYRKYYSGDLSGPVVPPLYLSVASVTFDGPNAVSITAEDTDLSQKRSGALYTLDQFRGLAR